MIDRRKFVKWTAMAGAGLCGPVPGFAAGLFGAEQAGPSTAANGPAVGGTLEPWTPGTLDIHHLAYGRGNSTFILCPDGTSLLIDAGTTEDSTAVSCVQKPDATVRPGEWIATYALRQMAAAGLTAAGQARLDGGLDYALMTHIHPDHVGDVGPQNPVAAGGSYRLTGISDVDARMPIGRLIDRGFPDYGYPVAQAGAAALNYLNFVKARTGLGQTTERIQVGRSGQIRLLRWPELYPEFAVRNLAANGEVWTGVGDATRQCFPALETLRKEDYPTENMCSAAVRLSYGKFDYFTGGDLTSDTEDMSSKARDGGEAWRDIETRVAEAAGPVEVAVADHHAYFDAVGEGMVRALRPEVFVVPSWWVGHPSILPLRRMLSMQLDETQKAGGRDVFATCVMDANRAVNSLFMPKVRSMDGHVIVRVAPGGDEFRVMVTDNSDDMDRVKMVTGLYRSR